MIALAASSGHRPSSECDARAPTAVGVPLAACGHGEHVHFRRRNPVPGLRGGDRKLGGMSLEWVICNAE